MHQHNYTEFEFFWGTQHPFSQWHPVGFVLDEITFNCAEQYMMYQKALLFKNQDIAEKILQTDVPGKQKALGRKVKGFDADIWEDHREQIVFDANLAKFSQHENLKKFLFGTTGKWIVEASPVDSIWGIGLSVNDPKAPFPEQWEGLNLLGEALMKVRETLSTDN